MEEGGGYPYGMHHRRTVCMARRWVTVSPRGQVEVAREEGEAAEELTQKYLSISRLQDQEVQTSARQRTHARTHARSLAVTVSSATHSFNTG